MSKPGVMLYFDDLHALENLEAAQRGVMLSAISRFAEFGEVPSFDDQLMRIVWSFFEPKLKADDSRYSEIILKKRYAVYCREVQKTKGEPLSFAAWLGSADITSDQVIPSEIGRYPNTDSNASSDSNASPLTDAAADTPMTAAAAILNAYGLPKTKVWLDAINEDIKTRGEDSIRAALKQATQSDKYGGVSVNYYRAFLNGTGAKKADKSDYLRRDYDDEFFKSLDADIDAAIDAEALP